MRLLFRLIKALATIAVFLLALTLAPTEARGTTHREPSRCGRVSSRPCVAVAPATAPR
jgi:hypothetical protein